MNTSLIASRRAAFTLIELLIVVAIISVLAAIAVPNFLEAQTRCKVARTQADHRAIATALESYRVDTNRYPSVQDRYFPVIAERMTGLTTPVAYITSLPTDPFYRGSVPAQSGVNDGFGSESPDYVYVSGNVYFTQNPVEAETLKRSLWSLAGRGPDGNIYGGGYCMAHPIAVRNGANLLYSYDATNGTLSDGDILTLCSATMGAAGAASRDD